MEPVEAKENTLEQLKPILIDAVNRILEKQHEMVGMREKFDEAIRLASKQSYSKGEVVSVERLLAIKELEGPLSIKSSEIERLVSDLHNLIFPEDIFILQNYFEVWVKIGETMVVNFAYDYSGIEVKDIGDLN